MSRQAWGTGPSPFWIFLNLGINLIGTSVFDLNVFSVFFCMIFYIFECFYVFSVFWHRGGRLKAEVGHQGAKRPSKRKKHQKTTSKLRSISDHIWLSGRPGAQKSAPKKVFSRCFFCVFFLVRFFLTLTPKNVAQIMKKYDFVWEGCNFQRFR